MSTSEAMSALRESLVALFAESISMADEVSDAEQEVLDAWNAVCEASPTVGIPEPITDDDIEARFE